MPFVMAGEPILTVLLERGFMYWMWFVAAVDGSMFDCVGKSGSLKDRRCVEPEAMADWAAEFQPDSNCRPQSMGTYSTPDTRLPPGELPQLYAQVIPRPEKASVSEASLYDRPRLPLELGAAADEAVLELGAAADEAAPDHTLETLDAKVLYVVVRVVGTDTTAEDEYW